jgi:SulP family sulfate permease
MPELLIPASAISLIGTLELAACVRANGARPDLRREILAQGWANIAGAFVGAFPASASLTRSALLRVGGGQTRLAGALAALLVVPIIFGAMPLVGRIPQATLAGVLIVTAFRMIDHRALRRIWRASAESRALLLATFGATLVLPLEWAVLVGAGMGLLIHIADTARPRLRIFTLEEERRVPIQTLDAPHLVVVEVSGALHYAAVEPFLAQFRDLVPTSAVTVVLDLTHAHQVRFTAVRALEWLAEELSRDGKELRLEGVSVQVHELLLRTQSSLSTKTSNPARAADPS